MVRDKLGYKTILLILLLCSPSHLSHNTQLLMERTDNWVNFRQTSFSPVSLLKASNSNQDLRFLFLGEQLKKINVFSQSGRGSHSFRYDTNVDDKGQQTAAIHRICALFKLRKNGKTLKMTKHFLKS